MNIVWKDSYATENYKVFKDNKSFRHIWEADAKRFEDFRYGSHFSTAEEKELLKFRQAPLPISITTAICDTAESMMVSTKPTIKVAPIIHPFDDNFTKNSKDVSKLYTHLLQKSWYDSLGDLQYDRVVRDYTNVGHGLWYVVPRMEYGEFNVDMKHLNWRYFYPDPSTKDPFYRDMDNAVIAMEISKESGYKFVRSIEDDITLSQYEEDFVKGAIGTVQLRSEYGGGYQRAKRDGILFTHKLTVEDQQGWIIIPKNIDLNRERTAAPTYSTVTELTDELVEQRNKGLIELRPVREQFLTEITAVGNKGYKKVYPINEYNVVPMVYDHRDSPYPLGRVWYLYPIQRAINKMVMVALLNGSLQNSLRVMTSEGSITNKDDFRKNFAQPGALLEWKEKVPGQSKEPIIIEPQPLSDGWLVFPRYLTYIMEYISGIFGVMMGDSQNTPDVFSTVASLQSAGGQKMRRRVAQSDATLSVVGRVAGKFYQHYAPPNGYSVPIDEKGDQQQPVIFNRLVPNPKDESDVMVDPKTDLSTGFHQVRFVSQPGSGYEAGTEAALLTNLATQLKVPEIVPLILKRLNLGDVDKIIQNMDRTGQQAQTIEQQAEVIKQLEQVTNQLANQVRQKGFEVDWAKFKAGLKVIEEKAKNDEDLAGVLNDLQPPQGV